ncbi:MAG: ABC transporter substrate-binding protein [Gammaproteobacteria bacterium]|nr:ABC transporter substrate-binding protein [Gammaproteobacteria bacterium]
MNRAQIRNKTACFGRCLSSLWLVLALAACSPPPDAVIRLGIASAPANLDPRFATDATSARINRLLYRRLVDFDERIRPVASLASWEVLAPDHYRFRLAPDRGAFHDGQPVTAGDVAATYHFILDPGNASPHRSALALIERIEVLDEATLDFFLERPDPLFPGYLVIGIVPASTVRTAHALHEQPLGSGPFRFLDWPEPGRLRLERIADGMTIEFLRVGDPTVRVLKLLRGEVDLLQNDLPAELLGYLDKQEGITVNHGPGSNFAYIGFNLEDPVTRDVRVRRAIAHAIDRAAIIEYVLANAAKPAAALLPPDHWAGNPDLELIPYAPQQARSLLAEAGYHPGDRPLELTYKTSTDPVRLRIATVIQQQLAEVGIRMKLSSYDWGTFYGDIKAGRFQLYSLAWVGIKTPDIFRYAFHSESLPPEGANRGRLADPHTDHLLEAAENAATLDSQAEYYRAVQTRLLEVLPYVPLWYEDHVVAARTGIAGYQLARDGNYDGLLHVTHVHP